MGKVVVARKYVAIQREPRTFCRASAYAAIEPVAQISTIVRPVTFTLFRSDLAISASRHARTKLIHCGTCGNASGLATISALVFSALTTINASGSSAIAAPSARIT